MINTASFVAVMGAAVSQISYTASKGAVLAMSRELGVEFGARGVRVNALCPGPVNTPLLQDLFAKDTAKAERRMVHLPMGRFAEPREIASAALFLACDESSYVNASTFLVDGGLTGAGEADPVLGALPDRFTAFQWHSYQCALPAGAALLARSPVCLQAYRVGDHAWGIQFHAEVSAADAQHWITDYRSDPDAIKIGLQPGPLHEETARRIAAWNEKGRELCDAFLEYAAAHSSA